MDRLVFAERCSAAILDGLPDKMGDPGVPTISCLIGTQMFDQALCDLGASVSVDLASNRNCGRYPGKNQEFFHTHGLHGTRD
jgi:hypothetical protein